MHVHEGNLRISTSRFIKSSPLCKGAGSVEIRLRFYGLQPMGLRQLKASRDEVKFIYSEKLLHVYKQNEDISMLNYLYKTGSINNRHSLLAHRFNSLVLAILFTMTRSLIRSFHRSFLFEYTDFKNTKLVHLLILTGSHSICSPMVYNIVILSWEQTVMSVIISVDVPFYLLMK